MLHFYDRATIAHALTLPSLPAPLRQRIAALRDDLIDWTEYLVIETGDTERDIIRYVGFSPLVEPIDGARFGQPGFHPPWDWIAKHDGWFELVFSFGSTFAYVLFVQDSEGVDPDLLSLCRAHRP